MRFYDEPRRCPKCYTYMRVKDGSDRTFKDKIWFTLECALCGHQEVEWVPRKDWTDR